MIKFTQSILILLILLVSSKLFAQEAGDTSEEKTTTTAETLENIDANAALQNEAEQIRSAGQILRLEDTIRGNKEQPQVLTIVPWQLPSHKGINATTQWQPVVDKLMPIERGRFLRNLQILNEISPEIAEDQE